MTYRRVHLHLYAHGSPTSFATIDYACALSSSFGASLRVTSPRLTVREPSHWLAGPMLAGIARQLEAEAAQKAEQLDRRVNEAALSGGVKVEIIPSAEMWPQRSDAVTVNGIAADVCVLGLPDADADQRLAVEAWLFGAGRPCLLHPHAFSKPFCIESIALAWDMTSSSARAIADALPLLKRARRVDVLTITGEKRIPSNEQRSALRSFLDAHDIECMMHERAVAGRGAGAALLDAAEEFHADLLVMGAFGHSRVQEFVLGGATKYVLDHASSPILMSH